MAATNTAQTTQSGTQTPATHPVSDEREVQTMNITQEVQIAAPVAVVWQTVLDEIGTNMGGEKMAMPMKLEAWPGGRWFRDLGNNTGHLWGHVQVIKPPPHDKPLLEICGPMAMSYAVAGHIQWRLTPEGNGTKLTLRHRAVGLIPVEHREGMKQGWSGIVEKIKEAAEKRR